MKLFNGEFKAFKNANSFPGLEKQLLFLTGCPRSGTSMLTKILDAHPDISVLMENIFSNRRRHWFRDDFWSKEGEFKKVVNSVFIKLQTPIVGNKVITPDVWSEYDILEFCKLFKSFQIVFIVRNPIDVFVSREKRENHLTHYNEAGRNNLLLNFSSRIQTYASSWRQNIENYWRLRDFLGRNRVHLIYYDDFVEDFENQVKALLCKLDIPFTESVLDWQSVPHYNSSGELRRNLKYSDAAVFRRKINDNEIVLRTEDINTALSEVHALYELWKIRRL